VGPLFPLLFFMCTLGAALSLSLNRLPTVLCFSPYWWFGMSVVPCTCFYDSLSFLMTARTSLMSFPPGPPFSCVLLGYWIIGENPQSVTDTDPFTPPPRLPCRARSTTFSRSVPSCFFSCSTFLFGGERIWERQQWLFFLPLRSNNFSLFRPPFFFFPESSKPWCRFP